MKVQSRSPEDSINDCFSPSALCLDFPLFEGKLFLRLSKEEWDDNRLFLHCFAHYLALVSATAVLIHDFSDYFSCLLDAISACFFVLCLGQFVLNLSFPQNSGSSCGRAQQQLAAFTHLPSKVLKVQRCCYQDPIQQTRRPVGLHLQGGCWRLIQIHSEGKFLKIQGSLQPNSLMLVTVTDIVGSSSAEPSLLHY